MAHYKRKKCRLQPTNRYSTNGLKWRLAEVGKSPRPFAWVEESPKFWDLQYHTRPKRSRERMLERAVLKGEDPANMVWPDGRKPYIYYW